MKHKTFQRWCRPKTILIVASSSTHPARIQQVIEHVRAPDVELMLVMVFDSLGDVSGHGLPFVVPKTLSRYAEPPAEGVRRGLLWAEVMNEVGVLKSTTIDRVPALANALNVDMVVTVSLGGGPMSMRLKGSIQEGLMDSLRVPLYIVGSRTETKAWGGDEIRRILLPVSLQSDVKLQLQFASHLARMHQARLTVLHVFGTREPCARPWERTPVAVGSHLPISELLREGAICPLEITVAEGDPATAILKFDAMRQHDLIVMGSRGCAEHGSGVLQTVMFGSRCPLVVLGRSIEQPSRSAGSMRMPSVTKREPATYSPAEEEDFHAVR